MSFIHMGHPGFWKDKKRSESTKKKISLTKQGSIPWNKGKICPQLQGERCHLYKGGISKIYKTGYNSPKYRQWRRDVFIRDEFTCQKCGKNHIYITAHHIKSWAHYQKLRFNVDNGITLCEDCHKKTDNYMGKNIGGKL